MDALRVGLCQLNLTVGDLDGTVDLAQKVGVPTQAWTVNDPEVAEIFGVDRGLPANMETRTAVEGTLTDPALKTTVTFENALAPKFGPAPAPPPKGHSGLRNKLRDIAESVSYGQATPADAAKQFFAEAQAALAG